MDHPRGDPLEVLIQTILSQNTRDSNSLPAYRSLITAYPDWESIADAPEHNIAGAIKGGGLANIKAKRIKETLKIIRKREGRISLDGLKGRSRKRIMDYLTSIPGIGAKTACCVMLFGLGIHAMPVDTHVFRIVRRLGWIEQNTSKDEAGSLLESLLPEHKILDTHLDLIAHGRTTCKARRPLCTSCPVRIHCRTHRSLFRDTAA